MTTTTATTPARTTTNATPPGGTMDGTTDNTTPPMTTHTTNNPATGTATNTIGSAAPPTTNDTTTTNNDSTIANPTKWSTIFAKPELRTLFHDDHSTLDTIHIQSLRVNTNNNHSIPIFFRAVLPNGIPHALLSTDTNKNPIVLVNVSIPKEYFPSPSAPPPKIFAITDDDKDADMSEIVTSEAKQLFKVKKYTIPAESRLCDQNLTDDEFAALTQNGIEPALVADNDTTIWDDEHSFPNFVYLHPVIASAIIKHLSNNENVKAVDLFHIITNAATTTDPNDGTTRFNTHWITRTMGFFWLMTQDSGIKGVNTIQPRPRILAETIRKELVATFFGNQGRTTSTHTNVPPFPPSSQPNTTHFTIAHDPALSQCLLNIATVQEEQVKAAGESTKAKSALSTMPDCKKTILIRGNVTDMDINYPKEVTESINKLFGKKSATDLYTALNATLTAAGNTCQMELGHVVRLNTFGPIWQDPTDPQGLTTFAFNPKTTNASNKEAAMLMIKQQQEHGNQQLDMNDVKIMLNSALNFAFETHHYQTQVKSLLVVLIDMWGRNSFVANLTQSHLNHANHQQDMYTARQRDDALFLTKVGFFFNLIAQRFLRKISTTDDIDLIDMAGFAKELRELHTRIENMTEICILPSTIMSKSKRGAAGMEGGGGAEARTDRNRGNGGGRQEKKAKIEAFECRFTMPNWKLPEARHDDYLTIFTKERLASMPKAPKNGKDRPFCNKALSLGRCRLGDSCHFNHDNPIKHNKKADVDAFYREAYAST
jgi:hypothetical protein